MHRVSFRPVDKSVDVDSGTSLLEAARMAGVELNTICGSEGICGKCKMIIVEGEIPNRVLWPFNEAQIEKGYVLACLSYVHGDLTVEIPHRRRARDKGVPAVCNKLIDDDRDWDGLLAVNVQLIRSSRDRHRACPSD